MNKIDELVDNLKLKLKKDKILDCVLETSPYGNIIFEASNDYSMTLVNGCVKVYSANSLDDSLISLTSMTDFLNKSDTIKKDCNSHFKRILKEFSKERKVMGDMGFEAIGYDVYQSDNLYLMRIKKGSSKFGSLPIEIHIGRKNVVMKKMGEKTSDVVVKGNKSFLHALFEYGKLNPMNFSLLPQRLRDVFSKGVKGWI